MAHYRGTAERQEKAKALAGVLVVHAALAAVILSGLDVDTITRTVERLKAFDVTEAPPPPPPPPPPLRTQERARDKEGAAAKKALPTPIVAPPTKIVIPYQPPVQAAPVPSTGSASSAGAALSGTGTGAGNSGTGPGGGGKGGGGGAGFTPAQRISKIPDREYRRFVAASGMRRGRVGITVKVNTNGRLSDCRVARSSGNQSVDRLMCDLTLSHVRFRPARDPQGRPVAQDITWHPDWAPNW